MSTTYRGHPVKSVEHDRRNGTYLLISPADEIVAELKQHEFLSQPQLRTLRHSNGGHRRSRAAVYSGPAGQSGYPNTPGTYYYSSPGPIWTWATFGPTPAQPIENAGIRAGEITAFRGWRVVGDRLTSIFRNEHEWLPGVPMQGDVRGEYGVHAFKEVGLVEDYARMTTLNDMWRDMSAYFIGLDGKVKPKPRPARNRVFAFGRIALWGEVIEHERGYRAEFGKIIGIDAINGSNEAATLLATLRTRYGVR